MAWMKLVAALAPLALIGAAHAAPVPADFKAKADAVLAQSYAVDAPGVAVVVMDDGKIVYSAGRGLADIRTRRPITANTVFRLGSITKQFTAAVNFQLRYAPVMLAAKKIRVNAIAPGYINTEMVQAVPKDVLEKNILPQIPIGRLGEPEEIARCVVFLASDDAGLITGSTLTANGGQYIT